jgi:hypothetical protein
MALSQKKLDVTNKNYAQYDTMGNQYQLANQCITTTTTKPFIPKQVGVGLANQCMITKIHKKNIWVYLDLCLTWHKLTLGMPHFVRQVFGY